MAKAAEATDFCLHIRELLDAEKLDEAELAFAELLELRRPRSSGLSELFAAFSPEAAERLTPAIVEAVRSGHVSLDFEDTHRLMSLIPARAWSNGYLCHRARIETTSPRVLQDILREIERRLAEASHPAEVARLSRTLENAKNQPLHESREPRAHPIYRSAADAVRPSLARGPPHLGGPMPELLGDECRALVRWTLERITVPFEPTEAEARALALLNVAYQYIDELRALRPEPNTLLFELIELSAVVLNSGGANARHAKRAVRSAAVMMASIGEGAAFVEELDREIMRIEAASMLERARRPRASFEVLARGGDERGKPAAWLLRAGDRHIFLAKIRKSWIYEEGERDEVIASIPDRWFDLSASALG